MDEFAQDLAESWVGIGNTANNSIGAMNGRWYRMLTDSWGSFKSFGEKVSNWFKSIPEKIGQWFSSIPKKIAEAFSNIHVPSPHWVGANLNKFPPSLGSIKWYKEGGIFSSPSKSVLVKPAQKSFFRSINFQAS